VRCGQFDDRHIVQIQLARRGESAVTGDDAVVAIDQDRVGPPVLDDAGGDLGHLLGGVGTRIPGARNQRLDLAVLDVEHGNVREFQEGAALKAKTRHRGGSMVRLEGRNYRV
jgi:hypothetical protein